MSGEKNHFVVLNVFIFSSSGTETDSCPQTKLPIAVKKKTQKQTNKQKSPMKDSH